MSKIISFGNQKGGTGKTTSTCLTANALASSPFNQRVFVADCDSQQSIIRRRLADQRLTADVPPYQVAFKPLAELQRDIIELDKTHDVVFLDLPGKLDSAHADDQHTIAKYLQYVDFLFIPFCPGNYSLESTLDYLRFSLKIKQARSATPRPLEIVGFINLFEGRTLDDKYLLDEINDLRAVVNIRWMDTRLQRYALFRNVDTFTTFYEPATTDKAKMNLCAFVDELKKVIQL